MFYVAVICNMHMIRKKRSDKPTVLPVRPPPPSIEEISDDIQNANDDDIVFTSGQSFEDVNTNMIFTKTNSTEEEFEKVNFKVYTKVEEEYNKVLKFVKLQKNLKEGQTELLETCSKLAKSSEIVETERAALETKLNQQQELFNSLLQ